MESSLDARYIKNDQEAPMVYTIITLIVFSVLFALCRSGEHAMDIERDFLIQTSRLTNKHS